MELENHQQKQFEQFNQEWDQRMNNTQQEN